MYRVRRFLAIGLYCFLFVSKNVLAVDPGLDWKTIEGTHIYVHYADGNKTIAEKALVIAEAAHVRLSKELNWQPIEKTHVIISDETDQPNGFATPIFFNRTVLYLAPPTSINTLEDFDDWLTTLIVHEYTHIVHLDKAAGAPEGLRNIFGRFFLLFPNLFQPPWIIEGVATHKETDRDRGIGRGQSTMFASMMRAEVAKGVSPLSHANLPMASWPAGSSRYLYGVYFMSFLAEKYGEQTTQAWVQEYSNNLLPFFINTNAHKVLGKNLTPLWQEFEQWLLNKFQPQIDAINARGLIAGTQISKDAYRTDSVRAVAQGEKEEVYYVRNSGYKRASLMHIDAEGNTEELADLNAGAALDIHPESGLLLTQNEFCNNYSVYKDIYLLDKKTNNLKRLSECGRYLYASWHPDGKQIIAVHHNAEQFEIHLLNAQAELQQVLWQAEEGEIVGQIDVSADGEAIAASVWRQGDGWNIEVFNIKNKRWQKITTGTTIAANPQYTPDGNILFSLESDGVYNLHRYNTATGSVQWLTNLIGGAFQSSQASAGGAIYYAGYSAEGFAIYKLAADQVAEESLISNETVFNDEHLQRMDYKISSHKESDYSALSTMSPRWWFPFFQLTEQRSEFGLTTSGGDALGLHNYALTASYDTKLEKPAAELSYYYADRLFLSASRMNEIFLDVNGELNRIANRDIFSAVLAFPDRYMQSQSTLLLSAISDTTADDELAAGALPAEDFKDELLGVAWLYETADLNPLSISLIDGMRLRLVAEDSDTLDADFSGQVYTLDWRQYIRTGRESVFALRFLQGWGTRVPRPFKLGGEGSSGDAINALLNGVAGEAVFNERRYALRGYKEGLPQLRGRRAQLLSAEWRFPLQRTEKGLMSPPVGIMQYFGTVFAETGSAYESSADTYYASAGIEFIADINLFYSVILRTRAGYAHGFDSEIGDDRLYLKLGSSF